MNLDILLCLNINICTVAHVLSKKMQALSHSLAVRMCGLLRVESESTMQSHRANYEYCVQQEWLQIILRTYCTIIRSIGALATAKPIRQWQQIVNWTWSEAAAWP